MNALFQRVPGKVEAENYAHQGPGKSYRLNPPTKNADRYRKSEPVSVEPTEGAGRRGSAGQSIRLSDDEWTSYDINSLETKPYDVTIKIKTEHQPAELQISVNGETAAGFQTVSIDKEGWQEMRLDSVRLNKGTNRLKMIVKKGTISIDYLDFH